MKPKILFNFRIIYMLFALVLISAVAYFFGYIILYNPMGGNDVAFSLSQAVWIDRYLPNIPFWYPLQGAGISIVAGYPVLFLIVSSVIHKITHLTLVQVFGLLQFSTLIFTSFGIYLFTWSKFKSQTLALVASLLYFLSPMTYVWIIGAGFYAQTFSFMFVPYAILLFDSYLECMLNKENKLIKRLYFLGSVVFISLTTMAHPATGIGVFIILTLYALLYSLLRKGGKRLENFRQGVKTAFLVDGTALALILFWLYPLQRFTGFTNRGFNPSSTANLNTVAKFTLEGTLGFPVDYIYTNFSIAPAVWGLALFTGLLGFFYSRKAFTLFIFAAVSIYLTGTFGFYALIYPILHETSSYFTSRFYTAFTLVLIPVLASLGAYYFSKTVFVAIKTIIRKLSGKNTKIMPDFLGNFLTMVFAILIVGFVVYQLRNIYSNDKTRYYYGPENGYRSRVGHSIYNIWDSSDCRPELRGEIGNSCKLSEKPSIQEQLRLSNWPPFKLSSQASGSDVVLRKGGIKDSVPQNPFGRIDITPNLGAETKFWPVYSDVSLVNTYNFQSSLIHPMWGYMQGVFYSKEKLYEEPNLINELGKYFGIDYLVLNVNADPIDKFQAAGWKMSSKISSSEELWQPSYATGLYSIISQPKMLLIGSLKEGAYEQAFRVANLGAIPYEEAYFVEGESRYVDSYSPKELMEFDLIFLHGYSYKNKEKAWKLLEQYVKKGGSLFVDNGWQFVSPDWGRGPDKFGKISVADLPEPFPVKSSLWQEFGGPSWDNFKLNKNLLPDVDLGKVDPPTYLERGWDGSVATKDNLRDGAVPVLESTDGRVVLAARSYGQGKVVWSGMNLIPYVGSKRSQESLKLINRLIGWLVEKRQVDEVKGDSLVEAKRPWPDKMEFTFRENRQNIGFVFRESYYPGWKAKLTGNTKADLQVYRSGPGFMYVNLPSVSQGDKLIFEYQKPLSEHIATVISIITAILLVIYLFGQIHRIPIRRFNFNFSFEGFDKILGKEEDY